LDPVLLDPLEVDADPDPIFYVGVDPDPIFHIDADPALL
jgi:hypothetical protein